MRVAIAAVGTRGDVMPLTEVGVRLREAGHDVVLAAPEPFRDEIERCHLRFRAAGGDPRTSGVAGGSPARLVVTAAAPHTIEAMGTMVLDALEHEPIDALLLSPFAEFGGHPLAEARGIASIGLRMQPLSATAAYPPAVLGAWSAGAAGNRLAGRTGAAMVDRMYGRVVTRLRRRAGLPPVSASRLRRRRAGAGWPILHGFSPAVVSRPADWRAGLDVVGYWWPQHDPAWRPSRELSEFLEAGPPPVYLGFGSFMTNAKTAARLSAIALRALRAAGVRGVIQAGWADLGVSSRDVLTIGEAPHEWLFPRMAAVVHACGAGTTAAGLRAGTPAVCVPVAGDQPFWARRLHALGVSPPSVPYWRLNAERLATAIHRAVTEPAYRAHARTVAGRLARDDGARAVVRKIEALTT